MWRSIASNGVNLIIVLLVCLGGVIGWGTTVFKAEGPLEQAVFFEVPRGASLRTVSNNLAEAGVIDNAMIFRLGADYTGRAADLKFGNYQIPAAATMDEILDILTKGGASTFRFAANYVLRVDGSAQMRLTERDPSTGQSSEVARFFMTEEVPAAYTAAIDSGTPIAYRVTLPEGLTSWAVVEGLTAAPFLDGTVEVPDEGSLAPDSYEVARGADRGDLIARMQAAQEQVLAQAWAARDADLPYETMEEALVMASIVEKETGQAEERPQVASVFVNRLRQGMKLQTDPTVIYGVTDGRGFLGRGIRQSELRRETPWNTYVINGLPPTPIANPGRASIEATLQPDETPYLFFVADGTGGHAFATTLREHNINVRAWRQIEAQRNQ